MAEPELPRQALIGAGSNLGDRRATLEAALAALRAHPGIVAVEASSFYETDPIGYTEQPLFLNLVVGLETILTPEELMAALLEIERHQGRVRTVRWGPRTVDLDLLAFEGEERATPTLTLPHPRMMERTFVTVPLRELLGRKRFLKPCWERLRERLRSIAAGEKVRAWPAS